MAYQKGVIVLVIVNWNNTTWYISPMYINASNSPDRGQTLMTQKQGEYQV